MDIQAILDKYRYTENTKREMRLLNAIRGKYDEQAYRRLSNGNPSFPDLLDEYQEIGLIYQR